MRLVGRCARCCFLLLIVPRPIKRVQPWKAANAAKEVQLNAKAGTALLKLVRIDEPVSEIPIAWFEFTLHSDNRKTDLWCEDWPGEAADMTGVLAWAASCTWADVPLPPDGWRFWRPADELAFVEACHA